MEGSAFTSPEQLAVEDHAAAISAASTPASDLLGTCAPHGTRVAVTSDRNDGSLCQEPACRFIAVHFPHWTIDLEMALLRRTLSRRGGDVPMAEMPSTGVRPGVRPSLKPGLRPGLDIGLPVIVVHERNRVQHVVGACSLATASGVRVGMTMAQAEAACMYDNAHPKRASTGDAAKSGAAVLFDQLSELRVQDHRHGMHAMSVGGVRWSDRIVSLSRRMMAIAWSGSLAQRAIERVAICLQRWIPVVALDHASAAIERAAGDPERMGEVVDTIVGDLTGCAALYRRRFRTEQALLQRITACLDRRGLRARAVTASTPGAAMAMARFMIGSRAEQREGMGAKDPDMHRRDGSLARPSSPSATSTRLAIPQGRELAYLAALPIESLRIDPAAATALRSVEVSTVGQLAALGRAGVAARLSSGPGIHAGRLGRQASMASGVGMCAEVVPRSSAGARVGRPRSRHMATTGQWGPETPSLFDFGGTTMPCSPTHAQNLRPATPSPGTCMTDVLSRLDRALDSREAQGAGFMQRDGLHILHACEPWSLRHDFETPTARMEAILLGCGVLLERLVCALREQRQGLGAAVWTFRHANVPVDTSTDIGGSLRQRESLQRESLQTVLPMRMARPSARAAHLWSILRARLERVPLDHAIESIECRIDHAPRQRYRQGRLATGAVSQSTPDAVPGAALASKRRASVLPHSASHGPQGMAHSRGCNEWVELMQASLGFSSLGSSSLGSSSLGSSNLGSSNLGSSCGGSSAVLKPQRDHLLGEHAVHAARMSDSIALPSMRFARSESATLFGGAECIELSRAVATRTAWMHVAGGVGGTDQPMQLSTRTIPSGSENPVLQWRGTTWPLRAVDGWQRVGDPWWEHATNQVSYGQGLGRDEPSQVESSPHDRHGSRAQMSVGSMRPNAAAAHDACVGSRICIGNGLWLSIRWPSSLSVRSHGAQDSACRERCAPRCGHGCRRECEHGCEREPEASTASRYRHGVLPRIASPRIANLVGQSPEALSCEAWMIGAADVFRYGVPVTVHGAWS